MDNLLMYLLKVSAGTTLLYLGYLLFFSKDTFYLRNRVILILTLILPVFIPAIRIPVASQSTVSAEPVSVIDNIIFSGNAFAGTAPSVVNSFDYNRLFVCIYFTIAGLVLLRGIISLISTFRIIKKGTLKTSEFPRVVITEKQLPPFSFYPYAVIPAEEYKNGNYGDILDHEFAHIKQGHTFDLLLGELFIAFQWFNPFVWLIKRAIVLNHEYLADRVSLSNKSSKEYQYRLLNFKEGLKNISLAHTFNSLIKNRIIMINKKPTPKYAMMKNILLLPVVASVMFACATPEILKSTLENPAYESSNVSYVKISKIEIKDSATVLHLQVRFTPGWWIDIPPNTYIKPTNSSEKVFIRRTEGIPLGKRYYMPESGEISFKLEFPKLDERVEKIDFGESQWSIKGITVKPQLTNSFIPKFILGNWYNKVSGNWTLSFFEALAVYKKQVWSYSNIDLKGKKGSVQLKRDTATAMLLIKKNRNGTSNIGESTETLIEYTKEPSLISVNETNQDSPFENPVFREDSATYSGFFAGYDPITEGNTFRISFNDVIIGGQKSYNIRISENGYFTAKIPVYYPHIAHIQSIAYSGSVFLEPGKDVFQMINKGINNSLFMGESAKINSDLALLKNVNSFDYNEMRERIIRMTPAIYKTYCLNSLNKDLRTLDSIAKEKKICAKAFQIKKMDMEYIYASHILDYDWYFKSAYREQHNIVDPSKELPVSPERLTAEYFNFLTPDLLNNPIGFLSDNYNAFMHSFKNIALIQPEINPGVSLYDKSTGGNRSPKAILYAAQSSAQAKVENFEKKLGLGKSIAFDVMFVQEQYQAISETLTPLSREEIRNFREHISNPFIADYFDQVNTTMKSEAEARKLKTGDLVNGTSSMNHEGSVNGIILDQEGIPLPGVNIQVAGTTIGTTADSKGQFSLNNISDKSVLFFTFVGYKIIKSVPYFNRQMIVKMVRSLTAIEQIVVTPGTKTVSQNPDNISSSVPENAKEDNNKEVPVEAGKDKVFVISEEMPTFPGGYTSLAKSISDQINYPVEKVRNRISGVVDITFVVKSSGKISDVKVVKSLDPILDSEALRVISSMPDWKPGRQNGKPVDIGFVLPVNFSLPLPESSLLSNSMANFYRFVNTNISYPTEAKSANDTGTIYIVLKLTKGGTLKESRAVTDRKEIIVPCFEEVVVVGYKPTTEIKPASKSEEGTKEHAALTRECLRVADLLSVNEIPNWKRENMEFALAFKFILK